MSNELAFLCHSSADSDYVCRVAGHLASHIEAFYYEAHQRGDQSFIETLNSALGATTLGVIFWGDKSGESSYQKQEVSSLSEAGANRSLVIVGIGRFGRPDELPQEHFALIKTRPFVHAPEEPAECARFIIENARRPGLLWKPDGLPANPHLFSYEKDIIRHYDGVRKLGAKLYETAPSEEEEREREAIREKIRQGCPPEWPGVVDFSKSYDRHENPLVDIGAFRPRGASVAAAALNDYGDAFTSLCLPEAGPRKHLCFPRQGHRLNVGIIVSGGIAPGINAVIDGIVQRHWKYSGQGENHQLDITGYRDGFYALRPGVKNHHRTLEPGYTSEYASRGGSILGTYRWEKLLDPGKRHAALQQINSRLMQQGIDILYVIGGDGSMKAAHALWTVADADRSRTKPLSIVAIPKTMDNDILWMWQSFGFLSAVEKARETVELLHTEVGSNPRICVLQLFGSDSGFVVSHAVVASATGQCDAALIPEVPFSMIGLARHLKQRICDKESQANSLIPDALVVMAETAIPVDVGCYMGGKYTAERLQKCGFSLKEAEAVQSAYVDLGLSPKELKALETFEEKRRTGHRIQGQTSDELRTAGLKIVARVLPRLLQAAPPRAAEPDWSNMRVFANEPRHLLRAIGPSTSDIIMGQRLGTLAVDNAMAGYTDCMISQWLTEFVLVPLELVVLGRKRIPDTGIFWKSVLAKTGQPGDLVAPWVPPESSGADKRSAPPDRRSFGERRGGIDPETTDDGEAGMGA